ncbi:hypothetical protein V8C86DRAFT_3135239 [Haematococcus lacustris]
MVQAQLMRRIRHPGSQQLLVLLGGPLPSRHPELAHIVSHRLLLHRTLPWPALLLLLDWVAEVTQEGQGAAAGVVGGPGQGPAGGVRCGALAEEEGPGGAGQQQQQGGAAGGSWEGGGEGGSWAWWLAVMEAASRKDWVAGGRSGGQAAAAGCGQEGGGGEPEEGGEGSDPMSEREEGEGGVLGGLTWLRLTQQCAQHWSQSSPSPSPSALPFPPSPTSPTPPTTSTSWPKPGAAYAATARAGHGLPHQAYLGCCLVVLVGRVGRPGLEGAAGLLPALLQGVSCRLDSPLTSAFSRVLDPGCSLFEVEGQAPLAAEELWPGALPAPSLPAPSPPTTTTSTPAAGLDGIGSSGGLSCSKEGEREEQGQAGREGGVGGEAEEGDSDDDSSDGGGFQAYDVQENLAEEAWAQADPRSLQLRALAAALRKADDVQGVLKALSRVELVIRAAPDELGHAAHELARALLHCRVPEWGLEGEPGRPEVAPSLQRVRALAALLATAPLAAGDTLLAELFSPHLDTGQRLLILDSLCAAAQELSQPDLAPQLQFSASGAPQLTAPPAVQRILDRQLAKHHGQHHGQQQQRQQQQAKLTNPTVAAQPTTLTGHSTPAAPQLGAAPDATAVPAPPPGPDSAPGPGSGERQPGGRTRVWGHVALAKRRQAPGPSVRNDFHALALRWAHGLVTRVDRVSHGVDLLGRDALLLCRLLAALGCFAECASEGPAAGPLAAVLLELLAAPQVHGHPDVAVRRGVLLAAGHALAALPGPRLAAALMGAGPPGQHQGIAGLAVHDASDAVLVTRLQWLQAWLNETRNDDGDATCRTMASACLDLQGALAAEAFNALMSQPEQAWPEQLAGSSRGLERRRFPQPREVGVGAGSLLRGPLGMVRQGVRLPSASNGLSAVLPGGIELTSIANAQEKAGDKEAADKGPPRSKAPLIIEL